MTSPIVAAYAEGVVYPDPSSPGGPAKAIKAFQNSGFNTMILGLFHVDSSGSLFFNNAIIVQNGQYVGDRSWPATVQSITGGSVTTVCASIGGGGVSDYTNIQQIYQTNHNSFLGTVLANNLAAFRKLFPSISIIDIDCEEWVNGSTLVAFCELLAGLGFKITFCPYTNQSFWVNALASLQTSAPGAVVWWNLQCYDGGTGNQPSDWSRAIVAGIPGFQTDGYIVAGDWTQDSPAAVQQLLSGFASDPSLGGGFIWTLDDMLKGGPQTVDAYASAIIAAIPTGN